MNVRARQLAILAFVFGSIGTARAESGDSCLSAPVEGQKLMRAGRLRDAHERFAICAQRSCPGEVVRDCTRWLAEVENSLPSVVVGARDPEGRDLDDVRVSIDDADPVEAGARAIPLDPGSHRFVFRRAGEPEIARQVVLREGEKNREVFVSFGEKASTESKNAPRATHRPVPAGVWVLGAVGGVALASFATFGALGVSERSSKHCDSGCSESEKSSVDTKLRIADISLGVSLVSFGIAAGLYFARPTVEQSEAARADVRIVPGGAVGLVGTRF